MSELQLQLRGVEAAKEALEGARRRLLAALESIQGEVLVIKRENADGKNRIKHLEQELEKQTASTDTATMAAAGMLRKVAGIEAEMAKKMGEYTKQLASTEYKLNEAQSVALLSHREAAKLKVELRISRERANEALEETTKAYIMMDEAREEAAIVREQLTNMVCGQAEVPNHQAERVASLTRLLEEQVELNKSLEKQNKASEQKCALLQLQLSGT